MFKTTFFSNNMFQYLLNMYHILTGTKSANMLDCESLRDDYRDSNYEWNGSFVKTDKYGRPIKSNKKRP